MLSLSFLKSHRKEGGALLWSFVFITEGEVLTAERLLSSAFGLTSSFCLDKLDWEPSHSESARENITRNAEPFLHFSEQQKGITDLSPPSNSLQRAATSPAERQRSAGTCSRVCILPPAPCPRKPHYFIVGNTRRCCQLSCRRSGTCVKLTLCNDCYQKCKCKWVSIGMNYAECS